MLLTYTGILLLAVLPVYAGAYASLRRPATAPQSDEDAESVEDVFFEGLRATDALLFPVLAGSMLGGLYLLITYISKDWVNWLLNYYMLIVGCISNTQAFSRLLIKLLPNLAQLPRYSFSAFAKDSKSKLIELNTSVLYVISASLSFLAACSYAYNKNWIASNIFGLCFAYNGIQLMALDSFRTGVILLSGLFFYDIYFVFGTKVMVTVALGIEAPIKIVFPRDIIHDFFGPTSMLGLGDIVIPGIYCALSLRYDLYRHHKHHPKAPYKKHETQFCKHYFPASIAAYILGLSTTIVALHVTKAAQPALLYLSPACVASTFITAWRMNDMGGMWAYREEDPEAHDSDKKA